MKTVNIHEAKTHLSRLVDDAARGQPFSRAGKPLVKVTMIEGDPPAVWVSWNAKPTSPTISTTSGRTGSAPCSKAVIPPDEPAS